MLYRMVILCISGSMSKTISFSYFKLHKPFGYLSQFTPDVPGQRTLSDLFKGPNDVYPVGRLDKDSEGLILLTNDNTLIHKILSPENKVKKYYVQVEGDISEYAIEKLKSGIDIRINKKLHTTLPAEINKLEKSPDIPDRDPPVRYRKHIPTCWISIGIKEGKNRQIRKMCAAVGFPVLRIYRFSIGPIKLGSLEQGSFAALTGSEIQALLSF